MDGMVYPSFVLEILKIHCELLAITGEELAGVKKRRKYK